ncbi:MULTISPECIES: restriction endonuclease subunit S [Pseudoxanthomonas]|uniref:restriction endonuclease subunit S n=1 Tax=Pseudoxanthomonas TaxID=83618 RepID=UPI0022F3B65F|nr:MULTISPECIES: restriction endonuclease subunit S [Pseudoxanthomonas]WBX95228.1 restriction endonuclease subunit S [Pseudoxanthomonas mexicana]
MSWTRKPLAEVADLCLGKMLDEKKNKGDPMPYLANVNVRWGSFDLDSLREMRFEPHELERYGLKHGDIVMCEGGEPGRCAIWRDEAPGMMIQKALHRIRPSEELDYRFLYYSFLCKGRNDGFSGLFTGSTIKHLPGQNLAKVEVSYPPRLEQERISDTLSAYDDLIENNRRRIRLLEDSARLLYREWFVHLRFPGHEHVKIVDGVPEGWRKRPMSEVCVDGNGIQTGPFGSQLHQHEYAEAGVPVVMPKDLIDFRIDTSTIARVPVEVANRLARHRMEEGDVVYGRRGDIGRRAFIGKEQVGFVCGTGCLRLRANPEVIAPQFFFDALGAPETFGLIVGRAKGSTMPNLNASILADIPILVPLWPLQAEYIEFVIGVSEQIATLTQQNEKLRQARDLLLPRLMNGGITV